MTAFVFKTSDGYELMGDIDVPNNRKIEDYEFYNVRNPLEIRYRESGYGSAQAVLVKYDYFGQNDAVVLFRHSIVSMYPASDDYAKTYVESIKSIKEQTKANKEAPKVDRATEEKVSEVLATALKMISSNNTFH